VNRILQNNIVNRTIQIILNEYYIQIVYKMSKKKKINNKYKLVNKII